MRIISNSEFKGKKVLILVLSFYILRSIFHIQQAFASEPTSSPSAEIQAKLKSLKEEIASKAAKFKIDVAGRLQNRGVVGVIKSKTDHSLLIATKTGTMIINMNEDTDYQFKGKSKITLKDFASEDIVAALGDFDDTGALLAKRVVKLTAPPEERLIIHGQVVSESSQSAVIKAKDNKSYTFAMTPKTVFKTIRNQDLLKTEIKAGGRVVSVVRKIENGSLQARSVYLVNYSPRFKKTFSQPLPSVTLTPANPTATKSAAPIKKPTTKKAP